MEQINLELLCRASNPLMKEADKVDTMLLEINCKLLVVTSKNMITTSIEKYGFTCCGVISTTIFLHFAAILTNHIHDNAPNQQNDALQNKSLH